VSDDPFWKWFYSDDQIGIPCKITVQRTHTLTTDQKLDRIIELLEKLAAPTNNGDDQ
jgi:hypothetical protein